MTEPVYLGYDIEMYIMMDCIIRNIPGMYRAAAMVGTIL